MIHPLLFIVGYKIISVPTQTSAELFNLCARFDIVTHSLGVRHEQTGDRRYFRTSHMAARKLLALCRARGIEARLESSHGLPELIFASLKRPGILVGALFFICMVFMLGRVIWDIRIEGNATVPDSEIIELLRESGIAVGSSKSELDIDRIQNRALILSDRISWISVNVTGTVADVEVREVSAAPEEADYICSNLVAKRNGKIVEFDKVKGNIAVELGEAVSEGQLLVGGIYGSDTEGMRFVRSRGQVMALCEREFNISVPLKFEKKVYTGRKKIKKSLIFFEKEVKFFGNSGNLYASCDTIDTVKYFDLFGLGKLPFGIRTVTYAEYETQEALRSEQTAREQANYLLWQSFAKDAPDAAVVSKKLYGRIENGSYILGGMVESLENIAQEREVKVEIN